MQRTCLFTTTVLPSPRHSIDRNIANKHQRRRLRPRRQRRPLQLPQQPANNTQRQRPRRRALLPRIHPDPGRLVPNPTAPIRRSPPLHPVRPNPLPLLRPDRRGLRRGEPRTSNTPPPLTPTPGDRAATDNREASGGVRVRAVGQFPKRLAVARVEPVQGYYPQGGDGEVGGCVFEWEEGRRVE